MPMAPARTCGRGHRAFTGSRCPVCVRRAWAEQDANRPSASQRGYDAAWKAVRRQFIAAHPTCSHAGCNAPTTDVDHIISIRQRPDLRLSWSNLRGFCHPHHSARTAREQSFGRTGGVGRSEDDRGRNRLGSTAQGSAEFNCQEILPGRGG